MQLFRESTIISWSFLIFAGWIYIMESWVRWGGESLVYVSSMLQEVLWDIKGGSKQRVNTISRDASVRTSGWWGTRRVTLFRLSINLISLIGKWFLQIRDISGIRNVNVPAESIQYLKCHFINFCQPVVSLNRANGHLTQKTNYNLCRV